MSVPPPITDEIASVNKLLAEKAQPLPFVAVFTSGTWIDVQPGVFAASSGLQGIQHVTNPGGRDALITYWLDETHFDDSPFAKLGASCIFSGGLNALQTPKRAIWKRYPPHQMLLSLAAAIGAVQVLGVAYEFIAAPPQLSVTLEKADGLYAIQGEPFAAKGNIENFLSTVNHREIVVKAVLKPASGPSPSVTAANTQSLPLSVPDNPLAGLGAGKSHTVTIVGEAPSPGNYNLELSAIAKAGFLAGERSFQATVPFRSWPDQPTPAPLRIAARPSRTTIIARVEVGRETPGGVECSATFETTRPEGLAFRWINSRPGTSNNGQDGTSVPVVTWAWPKMAGRTIAVAEWSFDGVSPKEMDALARSAEVNCVALEPKA